jgi:lipid A ethanolaminephosphotransferase
LVVSGACVVALGSVALVNYQGLSSLFRNHHELRLMLTPSNIVGASIGYVSERVGTARARSSIMAKMPSVMQPGKNMSASR